MPANDITNAGLLGDPADQIRQLRLNGPGVNPSVFHHAQKFPGPSRLLPLNHVELQFGHALCDRDHVGWRLRHGTVGRAADG